MIFLQAMPPVSFDAKGWIALFAAVAFLGGAWRLVQNLRERQDDDRKRQEEDRERQDEDRKRTEAFFTETSKTLARVHDEASVGLRAGEEALRQAVKAHERLDRTDSDVRRLEIRLAEAAARSDEREKQKFWRSTGRFQPPVAEGGGGE